MLDERKKDHHLIAIGMGSHGQVTRILGPVFGCPITYAALEEELSTAPGQLTINALKEMYHISDLNTKTAIFRLIGKPVDKSISHLTHNPFFKEADLNAVYVKMQVEQSELGNFLHYAKELPFQGLSVTMPLKEEVMKYLDWIDPTAKSIGAVNTLLFEKGKISGFNTDAKGALEAIEKVMQVKGKTIVMIGAGGAAKAIASEAIQRGAQLVILNRDVVRGRQLAKKLNCEWGSLDAMKEYASRGYDILINSTPVLPIPAEFILPGKVVMDIRTLPKDTEFLKAAKEKGCRIVYGYRMFVEQALGQYRHWFGNTIDLSEGVAILDKKAERILS